MIGQITIVSVHHQAGEELNQAVQLDEFERLKGSCHCTATFSQQSNNTAYVLHR
jgi:hypothetical protein